MKQRAHSNLKKWTAIFITIIVYYVIHEGAHLILALCYDVFERIRIVGLWGVQIVTTDGELLGYRLAVFSGISSIVTIAIGYLLYVLTPQILKLRTKSFIILMYYITACFLLLDPIYISILSSFIGGGGDINGILTGLGIPEVPIRIVFGCIALLNVFLFTRKISPQYTKLFRR